MEQRSKSSRRRSLPGPADIELYIEELVLHGFAASDRHAVAEAVEQELARLLAEQGLPEAWRVETSIDRLEGAAFSAARAVGPRTTGAQVARTVYVSRLAGSRPRH